MLRNAPKPNLAPSYEGVDSKGGGRVFATFAACSVCLRRIRSEETNKEREEISQTKTDRAAYLITRQSSPQPSFFSFAPYL
jgi:hypothetical protein